MKCTVNADEKNFCWIQIEKWSKNYILFQTGQSPALTGVMSNKQAVKFANKILEMAQGGE